MIKFNIPIVAGYEKNDEDWSTPKGFFEELESYVSDYCEVTWNLYSSGILVQFLDEKFRPEDQFIVIVFFTGKNRYLDADLIKLRLIFKNAKFVVELGDEPQTIWDNVTRARISDLSLSPDKQTVDFWTKSNLPVIWFTHWADEKIFYYSNKTSNRKQLIRTTAVGRKYTKLLSLIHGDNFQCTRVFGNSNTKFYQEALIAFQYARWSEVTRRVFEASACGCCVITNRLSGKKYLDKIFEDGISIVLYSNAFDLLYKSFYYLLKPTEALQIGKNAAMLVEKNHTCKSRVRMLISELNKICKSKSFWNFSKKSKLLIIVRQSSIFGIDISSKKFLDLMKVFFHVLLLDENNCIKTTKEKIEQYAPDCILNSDGQYVKENLNKKYGSVCIKKPLLVSSRVHVLDINSFLDPYTLTAEVLAAAYHNKIYHELYSKGIIRFLKELIRGLIRSLLIKFNR